MRTMIFAAVLTLTTAAPLLAQTERGYVAGLGGFVVSPGNSSNPTSGDILGEAGVRIAPRVLVVGDVGRFNNLHPSAIASTIDETTAATSAQGLTVAGRPRVPANYSVAGLRLEMPTHTRLAPYVLGAAGGARVMPGGRFTYTSGILPDGSTPAPGTDVTSQVESAGYFAAPAATTAFMYALGGGVDMPIGHHWVADIGYRFAHVNTDTPTKAQGAAGGLGYRF